MKIINEIFYINFFVVSNIQCAFIAYLPIWTSHIQLLNCHNGLVDANLDNEALDIHRK